jgi:hypothetical protein
MPNPTGRSRREADSEPTGEPLRCDSFCASANSNSEMLLLSQRNSSYDTRSPTSDSRIAGAHTSLCIASSRFHTRSGNSTSAYGGPKRAPGTGWPVLLRKPFPEELRFEGSGGCSGHEVS